VNHASPIVAVVLQETAKAFGFTAEDLRSARKPRKLAACRRVACFLLHDQLGLSYPEIGRVLERHHTSVLYNVVTVRKEMLGDGGKLTDQMVAIMGRAALGNPGLLRGHEELDKSLVGKKGR
jgi:chromosomal replication initiation ATPase DnaA